MFKSISVIILLLDSAILSYVNDYKPLFHKFIQLNSKGFGKSTGSSTNTNKSKVIKDKDIIAPKKLSNPLKDNSISPNILDYLSNHCPTINTTTENIRLINTDPPVIEINNFLSEEMCDNYINQAQKDGYTIQESQTFGNVLGVSGSVRTSSTWYMTYKSMKDFVLKINSVLNIPITRYEEPQIVRYQMGQQFSWHYDTLPKAIISSSGQRLVTVIAYLNDMPVSAGGATIFKDLNIQVRPEKGKALIFFPSYANGTIDDRTMHAGQIAMDTKWIAQLWIHQYDYTPTLPPGNNHKDLLDLL